MTIIDFNATPQHGYYPTFEVQPVKNDYDRFIYWYPDRQSTNYSYIYKFGVESQEPIEVLVDDWNVLKIDGWTELQDLEIVNDLGYINIDKLRTKKYTSRPRDGVCVFYIECKSSVALTGVQDIYINGELVFACGAVFEDIREELGINIANMYREIPDAFFKAIYDGNVRSDYADATIINRKREELLLHHWDILANKGSYNSLVNALKWWEWDGLELRSHRTYHDPIGKDFLDNYPLRTDMYDLFKKTTYISLEKNRTKITPFEANLIDNGQYVSIGENLIEEIPEKWSDIDIALKLSVLGVFYKEFFMPIHLDLLRCVLQDVVFTNHYDLYSHEGAGESDRIVTSGHVRLCCQETYDISPINFTNKGLFSNSELNIGTGAKVRVNFVIPVETISQRLVYITPTSTYIYKDIQPVQKGYFDLLARSQGQYRLYIECKDGEGNIYTGWRTFNVEDNRSITLEVMKFEPGSGSYMSLGFFKTKDDYIIQYLPGGSPVLNNILVFDDNNHIRYSVPLLEHYYKHTRTAGGKKVVVMISKNNTPSQQVLDDKKRLLKYIKECGSTLYRDDIGFIRCLHTLKPVEEVTTEDLLCVRGVYDDGTPVKYFDEQSKWTLTNVSTGEVTVLPALESPVLAGTKQPLTPGYYNIEFDCVTDTGTHRNIKLDSAFLMK